MGRRIKAIFFDIDGTLRDFQTGRVPDSAKEALLEARKAGILLFIATGRHKLEMEEENLLEGITFDGYVTLNGQYCYCKDRVIYDFPIDPVEVERTLALLEEEPFPCLFMEGDCMYINMVNSMVEQVQLEIGTRIPPVFNVERARNHPIYQMIPYISTDMENRLRKCLAGCEFIRWHDEMAIDVIPAGGSKWNGILKMAEHYGFSAHEMAAIGDGKNDISMITGAGLGIAMGNASDEVKDTAGYITDSIDADGLKKAVFHILDLN
ncbi:Cof-type HAD-IIB family hydrolase [Lacrimispora saccharolytica]|uniref:Cof-like hydrolase n=1 Tax=Lacrimispora saccharolytica (strain ATCC 35040 / DSM 2544 / NRCC 2533 / WM1) TaxID=610130 RepID=D9R290_LACSW|nr:Cof-type HAD-IIB family hydrolase [Lacrimispora saccharolytica]ADL04740.1 Cof-like hydrolase [[Clostridium] saccharolyticum WM1]QRV21037.1 Cof-type HAD-IIB family hydrolase [Lacrimispora saccharolytica]